MSDVPQPHDVSLAPDHLRRLASSLRELSAAKDIDQRLQLAVDLATEVLSGVDVADIMFVRAGRITTPVSTHDVALALDQAQQETGEGPCLTAFEGGEVAVSDDLKTDEKWPMFGPRAVELGVRSVVAFRLSVERNGGEDRLGALNLYGRDRGPHLLTAELGAVFAAHCSAVLGSAIAEEGLRRALRSRDLIGQAKGILMERHRLTADEAYELLRRRSNDTNTKVRDLAEQITRTGELTWIDGAEPPAVVEH